MHILVGLFPLFSTKKRKLAIECNSNTCFGADVLTKFVPNSKIRRCSSGTNFFDYMMAILHQIYCKFVPNSINQIYDF